MKEEILRKREIFSVFLEKEMMRFGGVVDINFAKDNIMVVYDADTKSLLQNVKKELQSWLMKYDSKDGYSTLYDQVLEHLSNRIDTL